MSNYIKFNKLNKYFKFILLTAFFRYFNCCILGYNFNQSFKDVSLFRFLYERLDIEINNNVLHSLIIKFFFNYIGTLFFSFFLRLYELKITQTNISHFFKFTDSFSDNQKKIAQLTRDTTKEEEKIKENILYKFKNYLLNNNSLLLYIVISSIWVIEEMTMFVLFDYLKDVDFWFFEIFIVTIIYSKIFLVEIYLHKKIAIGLNLIPTALKITCIVLAFISDDHNVTYVKYEWWIVVGFLIHCFLTAVISFIECSLKSFLFLKYTTISQILMYYSSLGIIISFLIGIISTFKPCSKDEIQNDIGIEIFCHVKDNNYTYFDNFKTYFNSYSEANGSEIFIRTIIIILDALTFFFHKYFLLLSINFTDPVHAYFYIPMYYILQKTVLVINNVIIDKQFFERTDDYRVAKYWLDISGDIFCFVGFLIYLEIIELNFCGLNDNLRKKITQRAITEDLTLFKSIANNDTDEIEDDSNDNSKMNLSEVEN